MEQFQKQAENVGTKIIYDTISKADFSKNPFICTGESGNKFTTDTVIASTGAEAKWLGLESEEKYRGYGISSCATCDGFFFKGKNVAVIGGGNTATEEALFLTNFAKKVILIHRRDQLRADQTNQTRLLNNPKIKIIWNHVLEEVIGEEDPKKVTGINLRDVKSNIISYQSIDGVFIAIGHNPMTQLFKGKLDMDKEGYIICPPGSTHTSIPGVFAAGDVQDKVYRQAVTAAGQGCMAALEAERFIAEKALSQ
jgi:thioredoxin reductase (NADPH)